MVDFKKHAGKKTAVRPLDPVTIYDSLDRASDKGPLREGQAAVLEQWNMSRPGERDVIVKMHTGQGKTLIGLLILQSKLNEAVAPVVYLCANNFLVKQTADQAKQFGLHCVTPEDRELPTDFLDGQAILITSVQKLFNGKSKFGLGPKSVPVGALVMDDSHACVDAIRDQCMIRLPSSHQAYAELFTLFSTELEEQGMGTYADISRGSHQDFLPVPYWDWIDKSSQVARILSKYSESDEITFAWPLLRDMIADCFCAVSGSVMEISPYLPPLHLFGSYDKAQSRTFMSATVTNDSFLVKGLGLSPKVIREPLVYEHEKWAGEKMVLIPTLIDPSLDRGRIVEAFAKPSSTHRYGIVALTPSFSRSADWKAYGAIVPQTGDIEACVEHLVAGDYEKTLVLANRYDGIDLPDNSCRILIMDSRPYADNLQDRYTEACRAESQVFATRTARIVEQGLGRSVRGVKDYSVIILVGPELVKTLRTKASRSCFSVQTQTQVEIGLEIAEYAKEEIAEGAEPWKSFMSLIRQCLGRDQDWKSFYVEKMDNASPVSGKSSDILSVFSAEREAELFHQKNCHDKAVEKIQTLIDTYVRDEGEKGWYLQEMARYRYPSSKQESKRIQVAAHGQNRYLLKPREGVQITKISTVSQKRVENAMEWLRQFETFEELFLEVDEMLGNLRFGVEAPLFEAAFDNLGTALGFKAQRPEKEWKEGPDNLWALRDGEYLLVECKSKVELTRDQINKVETGQMNNAIAWFRRTYQGAKSKNIMVIPTKQVSRAGGFNEEVDIMRDHSLKRLVRKLRAFFLEFKNLDMRDLSERHIQKLIDTHGLSVDDLVSKYSEKSVQLS